MESKFCCWRNDACNTYKCCNFCRDGKCTSRCKDIPTKCKYSIDAEPIFINHAFDCIKKPTVVKKRVEVTPATNTEVQLSIKDIAKKYNVKYQVVYHLSKNKKLSTKEIEEYLSKGKKTK